MVIVDSSVWVEFFRCKNSVLVESLRQILDDDQVAITPIIWIEILCSARRTEVDWVRHLISALPQFFPNKMTWSRIDEWIDLGFKKGQHFGATDLIIAAIAADQRAKIWSLDSDFERMQKLGFVELHSF